MRNKRRKLSCKFNVVFFLLLFLVVPLVSSTERGGYWNRDCIGETCFLQLYTKNINVEINKEYIPFNEAVTLERYGNQLRVTCNRESALITLYIVDEEDRETNINDYLDLNNAVDFEQIIEIAEHSFKFGYLLQNLPTADLNSVQKLRVRSEQLPCDLVLYDTEYIVHDNCRDVDYDPLVSLTTVTEDGAIKKYLGVYTRDNTGNSFAVGSTIPDVPTDEHRGYYEYNISVIPDHADITDVSHRYYINGYTAPEGTTTNLTEIETPVSSVSNQSLFTDIGNGTVYATFDYTAVGWYVNDLGATADSNLESQLSEDYFGVGLIENAGGEGMFYTVATSESPWDSSLNVTYTIASTLKFIAFTYPNGTITLNDYLVLNASIVLNNNGKAMNFTINGTKVPYMNIWNIDLVMYNFDNISSLGDSSSNVKDVGFSTENSNCTIKNGAYYVDGKYGKALKFDGINDWCEPLSPAAGIWHAATYNRTFSLWLKADSPSTTNQMIIDEGGGVHGFCLALDNEVLYWVSKLNSVANITTYPYNYTDWHYIEAVYNGSDTMLYIDAVFVNSTRRDYAQISAHGSGPALAGSNGGDSCSMTTKFNGTIDEFRMSSNDFLINSTDIERRYHSNLNQHNLTQWYFQYIKQYSNGTYTYEVCVKDEYNYVACDKRTLIIKIIETYYYYLFIFGIPILMIILARKFDDVFLTWLAGILFTGISFSFIYLGITDFENSFIQTMSIVFFSAIGFYYLMSSSYKIIQGGI